MDRCERAGTWNRRSTMLISADRNRTSRSSRSLPPTRSALSRESHNVVEDLSGCCRPPAHSCLSSGPHALGHRTPDEARELTGHGDDRLVGTPLGGELAVGG